jgi:hypothetical protein
MDTVVRAHSPIEPCHFFRTYFPFGRLEIFFKLFGFSDTDDQSIHARFTELVFSAASVTVALCVLAMLSSSSMTSNNLSVQPATLGIL